MKIKVSKQDLQAAMQVPDICVAGSGSDLSAHFLFRIHDGAVQMLAYNQRVFGSAPVKCQFDGDEGAAFTVEGWRLRKWLAGVADAVLTFTKEDGGEVKASAPKSTIRMRSLDPSKFPFWDKSLGEAKAITTINATRLASALNYGGKFISDKDSTKPEIGQVESLKGCIWATDKKAVTLISVKGLEDSNLRIHSKDISPVTKFLSYADDVEVLEHDRSLFLRRADGAVLGTSRPLAAFPKLGVDKDAVDDAEWEVKTADLTAAIKCLSASADKDNTSVVFRYRKADNMVVLSVTSAAGGSDEYPIECTYERESAKIPEDGFELHYPYLETLIEHFKGDTLKFGVTKKDKGGFIRFLHAQEGDSFLTVVVWRNR